MFSQVIVNKWLCQAVKNTFIYMHLPYKFPASQILGRPESDLEMEWVIEDSLGSWWRPNFEAPQVWLGILLFYTLLA
jgi:hypothetical protein